MNASKAPHGRAAFWAACFGLLLAVRACHVDVLWVDEAYGMAGARRILEGASLYRDLWFDKPPLYAWVYLAWGVAVGWPLRIGGAVFALLCCLLAARAAASLFGRREGYWAAAGMAFFLSFDHPVAVLSLAPDLLLIPFALAAVWAISAGRPVASGVCAAAGLLANAKALALLPLILCWRPGAWKRMLAAYATTAAGVALAAHGWWEPVWEWGFLYSRDSFVTEPLWEGLKRTANWAGFHAALLLGAAAYFSRKDDHRARLALWLALAGLTVAAGWRFFPRYYLALLPPMVIAAARGLCLLRRRWAAILLLASLTVPAVRFGVRHVGTLRGEPGAMRDLALWQECREAAVRIRSLALPGDTLLVWGYRPELNVLAGLPGATRFLDSQPLTGVLADRHFVSARATAETLARRHRQELAGGSPVFIADGLGPRNPALAITQYSDLSAWLAHYALAAEVPGFRIYQRRR